MKSSLLFLFLFWCFVFLSSSKIFAQSIEFVEVPQNIADFDGVYFGSIAFSDVDGDGDLDVLITGLSSSTVIAKLYENDGNGNFAEVIGTPFEGVFYSSIAFYDIDGDGDPDVLITGRNSLGQSSAKLYTNDGSGNFTQVNGTPFEGVQYGSIAFSDLDGDGNPDVLITGENNFSQRIAKLYTNDGNGNYTEVNGTPFDGVRNSSIAITDVDGDDDLDVLITGYNTSNQAIANLYANNGSGNFSLVIGTPFEGVWYGSIAFSDVDGDEDTDVLISGRTNSNQRIAKLYINDGTGSFTEVSGTPFDEVEGGSIAFSDMDGDEDVDVLITGFNSSNLRVAKLYANDGSGNFTEVIGTPFDGVIYSSIAFTDVDGDGDPDVLITGQNIASIRIAKLYINDGGGNFGEVGGSLFDGVYIGSIAFSDVDGDGDRDVLITGNNSSYQRSATLYTNNGNGIFSEVSGTTFEGIDASSIAFSDVDGDGDSDVLFTGYNSANQRITRLYANDGNGDYTEVVGTTFADVWHGSVAFSDVDGDGDPDVLITGQNSSFTPSANLYTNDGNGNFSVVSGTPFVGVMYSSLAVSDVDGDGDPDVMITGLNSSNQPIAILYNNDGNGNFSEASGTSFVGVRLGSVAFADVDGDGDPDILMTGLNSSFQPIAKLYTNDGSGNFTEVSGMPFIGVGYSSIAFSDVDGDGDPDVLITGRTSSNQYITKLYANDGSGNFTEVSNLPFVGVGYSSIAFSDVDGDGDPDVLIAGVNNSNQRIARLYRNVSCNVATGTNTLSACGSYTWIDGNTYTESNNTATFNIEGGAVNGCDSLVVLNLTIFSPAAGADIRTACDIYTWIDGNTYTESNSTAQFNIVNGAVNGCDSLVTLDLTIVNNNLSFTASTVAATVGFANGSATISVSGGMEPYTYQWDDSFLQTTATAVGLFPGSYTCVVTDAGGCEISVEVGIGIDMDVPLTGVNANFCNTGGYDLNEFISATPVSSAGAYRWEFTPSGGSPLPEYTRNTGNQWIRLQWVNGVELATTYNVRVKARVNGNWGDYGSTCTISTASNVMPTGLLPNYSPTNAAGNDYALCDFAIAYNVSGSENFRWRFDPDLDPNNANEIIYTRGTGTPSVRLSWVNGLIPGFTYNVAVEVQVAGQWSGYSTVLPLTLAPPPNDVAIRSQFCNGTYAPNGYIMSQSVCDADLYQFRFTPTGGGIPSFRNSGNYVCFMSAANPALTPGDYDVQVKVTQNGVPGDWGPACTITISSPQGQVNETPALRNTELVGSATLFPNPNAGNEVRVNLDGLSAGNHDVMIQIYDIYGKLIQTEGFGHEGNSLSRLVRFDGNLSMGMYMVQITVDGERFATERLVVK